MMGTGQALVARVAGRNGEENAHMPWPLVSVLIPAFNAGRTIDRALASVFAQNYQPLEILVIDDGSTDDTAERVAKYRNKVVRPLGLGRNRGVSAATNAGLALAKGEFIAFLDADDEWLPGKLRAQLDLLERHPGMSFVCGPWREIDLSGLLTLQPLDAPPRGTCRKTAWRELLARSFVLKSTVIARATHVLRTGGFDENLLIAEDQDMWIRLAMIGTVGWHPEPLTVHHETPHSLTHRHALRQKDFVLPMIAKHVFAQRHNLTSEEIRGIFGTRYAQIGRSLYHAGRYFGGLYYLGRAILLGTQPAGHLAFILVASPPIRWLRHRMRSAPRASKDM
jgi:glycosyltransferase involved in cell wall biosynthesis